MVISFNESDWTSGWNHLLVGATLYLLPSYENTLGKSHFYRKMTCWKFYVEIVSLDPDDSIALNPNEIPMVTFRQRITKAGFQSELHVSPFSLIAHCRAIYIKRKPTRRNLEHRITLAENRNLLYLGQFWIRIDKFFRNICAKKVQFAKVTSTLTQKSNVCTRIVPGSIKSIFYLKLYHLVNFENTLRQ